MTTREKNRKKTRMIMDNIIIDKFGQFEIIFEKFFFYFNNSFTNHQAATAALYIRVQPLDFIGIRFSIVLISIRKKNFKLKTENEKKIK